MMKRKLFRTSLIVLTLAIGLAACAPAQTVAVTPTEDTMMAQPTENAMMPQPTAEAVAQPTGEAMMNAMPDWLATPLTDVNSGQTFKLSDFHGKPVLVEAMAVWCTNCLALQHQISTLRQQIGDSAVVVSLDVDLNEDTNLLKQHAERNGFDWHYAVASADLVKALAAQFGNQVLNPPSTPVFIVDKDGGVHLLDFGTKSADYLAKQLAAYE
jgi:thiol-disulfide isomerase/thioredoxin